MPAIPRFIDATRSLSMGAWGMRACLMLGLGSLMPLGALGAQQLPLGPVSGTGRTVTPAFEGWYRNADGTFTLSFGYFNRNREAAVEIPVGSDNFMSPGDEDRGQPTRFEPWRHWGVFTVTVPADFGGERVVWTLKMDGESFAIPGNLKPDWEIDALAGEAGSGNTPPVLSIDGQRGQGPGGTTGPTLEAVAGEPIQLSIWAEDDGRPSGNVARAGDENAPVKLTWFKHRGPGQVTFTPTEAEAAVTGAEAHTMAVFSAPGEYVVRVRANDASGVTSAGHAQCCWTNGFLKIRVTES